MFHFSFVKYSLDTTALFGLLTMSTTLGLAEYTGATIMMGMWTRVLTD